VAFLWCLAWGVWVARLGARLRGAVPCQALFIHSEVRLVYTAAGFEVSHIVRTYRSDRKLRPLAGMGASSVTK
jgi:hypothetical protein